MSTVIDEPSFVKARADFTDAFSDLARGKRNWQIAALWLSGLASFMVLAYVRLATGPKVVPYLIEVDKLGEVVGTGTVDAMRTPEPRLVAAQVGEFLRCVRGVLPVTPPELGAAVMRRAYTFVDQSSPAATTLNAWFSDPSHDPRILGRTVARMIKVTEALPMPGGSASGASWKVRWVETDLPLVAGGVTARAQWEGYLTVKLQLPTTAESARDNPLGVFVTSISWNEITEPGGTTS